MKLVLFFCKPIHLRYWLSNFLTDTSTGLIKHSNPGTASFQISFLFPQIPAPNAACNYVPIPEDINARNHPALSKKELNN